MNRSKSPQNNAGSLPRSNQQSNRSSAASVRSAHSSAKPSPSTYMNNNVVPKGSTTSSLGSGRPLSASPLKGKVVYPNKRPLTTPLSQRLSNLSRTSGTSNLQNKKQNTQGSINFQKIFTAASPSKTNSTMSVRSNGSNKARNNAPSNNHAANKPTTSTTNTNNNSNANNKPQEAVSANKPPQNTTNGSSVTNSQGMTQLRQQPPAQVKLPYPTPLSQQRHLSNFTRSTVLLEKSRNFRTFVERAINEHKVFSCCGVYPAIKNALKKRGWVEKPGPLMFSRSTNAALYHSRNYEDESDTAWLTRILKDYPPDFIWVIRRDNIDWKNLTHFQMINRFPKAYFTTKTGLAACLQHMHWFSEAGVADTFFPRCYRLTLDEERQAFQDDFRLTACMSYLKYFVNTYDVKGTSALADVHSKITPLSIDFACRQLGNYMRMRRHEDIDWLLPPNFMTQHWDAFIHQYYAVVHEKKKMRFDRPEAIRAKYDAAKKMLQKVAQYWPQYQLDGVYNMWICKPGARSRGNGIVIKNNLEKIMDLLGHNNFRECNWVVQKYIERPLLIYKTKFDIRQWFLVTDWTPLTVWFYKESYIRFCTKPFLLEDFHESIHLCNNAIQARYQNSSQRDPNLPEENMWSSDTFQLYLRSLKRSDAWPMIYSGMKQAIVGVLLSSQETIENKKGCYELYGADFMLTDDFRPWLIEINSCPCMAPTTSVTTRMCAQCLEDTIKVVVDRKHNRNADTGHFELIYRQNAGSVAGHEFNGNEIAIVGKRLTRDADWPTPMAKQTNRPKHQNQVSTSSNNNNVTISSNVNTKQTLADLLQKLRVRNQEMYQGNQQSPQLGLLIEKQGGSMDTNTLLDKMLSFKPAQSEKDKPVTPQKPGGGILRSGPGKGEEASPVTSKYIEMNNSFALLLKNNQNSILTDLIKVSKETAQELMSRSKNLEDGTKPKTQKAANVPKTLAEAKAMVESTMLSRMQAPPAATTQASRPPTPKQQQNSENSPATEEEKPITGTTPDKNELKSEDQDQSVTGLLGPSEKDSDSLIERDVRLQSKSESTLDMSHHSTGASRKESNEDSSVMASSITSAHSFRRTKSLSFATESVPRSWIAERDFEFLKAKASEHSIISSVSQRSITIRSAPSYMIYPEAAHGSCAVCPDPAHSSNCAIYPEVAYERSASVLFEDNDRMHYTDGTNSTTPSHADIVPEEMEDADEDDDFAYSYSFAYNFNPNLPVPNIHDKELTRIEEVTENEDSTNEEETCKTKESCNALAMAESRCILGEIICKVGSHDENLEGNQETGEEQSEAESNDEKIQDAQAEVMEVHEQIQENIVPENTANDENNENLKPSSEPQLIVESSQEDAHQTQKEETIVEQANTSSAEEGNNDDKEKPAEPVAQMEASVSLIDLTSSNAAVEAFLARARENVTPNGANPDENDQMLLGVLYLFLMM